MHKRLLIPPQALLFWGHPLLAYIRHRLLKYIPSGWLWAEADGPLGRLGLFSLFLAYFWEARCDVYTLAGCPVFDRAELSNHSH